MANKIMRTKQTCIVRSAPALHGADIPGARIYPLQSLIVDDATLHDGWIRVVGPNPPIQDNGTYLQSGKEAWIEYAHLEGVDAEVSHYTLEVNWSDKTVKLI